MVHAISIQELYPKCNDKLFREFMTKSRESVLECYIESNHHGRTEKLSVIRFAAKDALEIPFTVARYNDNLFKPRNFNNNNSLITDGIYLVPENAIIFNSSYEASRFGSVFENTRIYISTTLEKEIEEHLQEKYCQILSIKKFEDHSNQEEYPNTSSMVEAFINDVDPILYVTKHFNHFQSFQSKPIPYLIKYIRGEDFSNEAFQANNLERNAARLAYVEQKFEEYKGQDRLQRSLEIARILRNELASAVNITVVKRDGTEQKVKSRIGIQRGAEVALGDYYGSVDISDVHHILYKKKQYALA